MREHQKVGIDSYHGARLPRLRLDVVFELDDASASNFQGRSRVSSMIAFTFAGVIDLSISGPPTTMGENLYFEGLLRLSKMSRNPSSISERSVTWSRA